MLFLSRAKITIKSVGDVTVEGDLQRYQVRIRQFLTDLHVRQATIHYRFERYVFSKNIDARIQQRIRNFLFNECPLKKSPGNR